MAPPVEVKPRSELSGTSRRRTAPASDGSVAKPELHLVLADDHPIFREGLRRLLEARPGLRVIGEASDGNEAVRLVHLLRPDILLLDIAMPYVSGLEALRQLSGSELPVRTIVVTAALEPDAVIEVLQLGARGVLLKESSTTLLFKCIECVAEGQYWVGREEVANLVEYLRRDLPRPRGSSGSPLTGRELEIVTAIVGGLGNKEIARQFAISEQTVKHHLTRVYSKLGVANRLELALYAIQHRLGGDPPR